MSSFNSRSKNFFRSSSWYSFESIYIIPAGVPAKISFGFLWEFLPNSLRNPPGVAPNIPSEVSLGIPLGALCRIPSGFQDCRVSSLIFFGNCLTNFFSSSGNFFRSSSEIFFRTFFSILFEVLPRIPSGIPIGFLGKLFPESWALQQEFLWKFLQEYLRSFSRSSLGNLFRVFWEFLQVFFQEFFQILYKDLFSKFLQIIL